MNMPLSPKDRKRLEVKLPSYLVREDQQDDYFEDMPIRRDITAKHGGKVKARRWGDDEGRNRRNERRQVRAVKRSYLD